MTGLYALNTLMITIDEIAEKISKYIYSRFERTTFFGISINASNSPWATQIYNDTESRRHSSDIL